MRVALFLVLLACAPVLGDEPDQKLHNRCLYPTVLVKGGNNFGTGVVVRSGV